MSFRLATALAVATAAILALAGCNRIDASRRDQGRPVPAGPNVQLVPIESGQESRTLTDPEVGMPTPNISISSVFPRVSSLFAG